MHDQITGGMSTGSHRGHSGFRSEPLTRRKHAINRHDTRNAYAASPAVPIEMTMQRLRQTEANILGYRLDRIEETLAQSLHYEVHGPEGDNVIARFRDRSAAERFIVARELRTIRVRRGTPAY